MQVDVYDAEGRRVRKTASGQTHDYIYDLAGRAVAEVDAGGSMTRGEIYLGSRHIATYSDSTYFSHVDSLGTERVRTGVTGAVVESFTSLPFGDALSSQGVSPIHLTGQERDTETGLDHFWFRQYSSTPGRWLTPDPAGLAAVDLTNPQSLNRYAYVMNNPTGAVDPYGLVMLPPSEGGGWVPLAWGEPGWTGGDPWCLSGTRDCFGRFGIDIGNGGLPLPGVPAWVRVPAPSLLDFLPKLPAPNCMPICDAEPANNAFNPANNFNSQSNDCLYSALGSFTRDAAVAIIPFGFAADMAIQAATTDWNSSTEAGFFFAGSVQSIAEKPGNTKFLKKATASAMTSMGQKAFAKEAAAGVGKLIPFFGQALTAVEVGYGGYKAWQQYKQCISNVK